MIISRNKRTPSGCPQQLRDAASLRGHLSDFRLPVWDAFWGRAGELLLAFVKCCSGDETQNTGLGLHSSNFSCVDPQKIILYEVANGISDPCKRAAAEKSLFHLMAVVCMFIPCKQGLFYRPRKLQGGCIVITDSSCKVVCILIAGWWWWVWGWSISFFTFEERWTTCKVVPHGGIRTWNADFTQNTKKTCSTSVT